MPNTNEQLLDVIDNCNILLNKFAGYDSTDNTPEGRMIAQLTWLKERAENHDLPLPVQPEMLGTLRYIYMDGTLNFHASNPSDRECVYWEMEVPMERLLNLAKHGRLLLKDEYLRLIPLCIDALLLILSSPPRNLVANERKFCEDLNHLKKLVSEKKFALPQRTYMPQFESFIKSRNSLTDIENVKPLFKIVDDLIFNGVRPDTWLTPEDAEREVKSYFTL
ncbi:hypothetical protein [Photobacterium lutimaris]|uniref:Uncharacterized protein n=1 Tax=Photobacterium lutimaris TaxID=388278 RepID=A0A2T3IL53_9GAMM|nr:hypothetical protein [Photobacterium lutimaris]PSU29084.1 hypothetical protein C9I99_25505 [Photobacterium lutimaris]TDR75694.1 hypothetical protein DFP78_10449 [Photobacterium lutimaris]